LEFVEVPAALGLGPEEWSLLPGFLTFDEETRDRIPHLCQIDEARVDELLSVLQNRGLVRTRRSNGSTLYSLAPAEDWLDPAAPGRDVDRLQMEISVLNRLLEAKGRDTITVISTREIRRKELLVPDLVRYSTTLFPTVDLRMGTRCNLNCVYCMIGHEDRYLRPVNDILENLKFAREQNIEKVSFTGGEPTLHPDLLKMVAASRAMGYRQATLVTNGVILSYPGRMERLIQAGITAVGISFDTPDRQTAEAMWRSPVFDRVVQGMQSLADHPRIPLGSIAVITSMNYRQLPALSRFFVDLKRSMKNLFVPTLDFVMPEENAWLHRGDVVPRLTEVAPYVREALEYAHANGLPLTFRGLPPCLLPGLEKYGFDRYMTIFRLVRAPDGSVYDKASLDMMRTKMPDCRDCHLNRECTGVSRSYANLFGLGELEPTGRSS